MRARITHRTATPTGLAARGSDVGVGVGHGTLTDANGASSQRNATAVRGTTASSANRTGLRFN